MEEATKKKIKKTANIVVNVILWLFVAFAVFITVVAVSAASGSTKVPVIGGKCYMSVQSNSMNADKPASVAAEFPSGFKKGDFIVGKYIYGNDEAIGALKEGDIVTFEWDINGDGAISKGEYNSHRIIKINKENGTVTSIETRGDNEEYTHGISETVSAGAIIAVYTGKKANGLGATITFLGSRLGFGLCILLPLTAFFVYQLVVFIITVVRVKNSDKKVISAADEELIKQKAIEEYLRSREADEAATAESIPAGADENPAQEIKAEENEDETAGE